MERRLRVILANMVMIPLIILPGYMGEPVQAVVAVVLVGIMITGFLFGMPGYKVGLLLMFAGLCGLLVFAGAVAMWLGRGVNAGILFLALGLIMLNYEAYKWDATPTVTVPEEKKGAEKCESLEDLALSGTAVGLTGLGGLAMYWVMKWQRADSELGDLACSAILVFTAIAGISIMILSKLRLKSMR